MATLAADSSSGAVAPGLVGFLVVVVLGIALWLLLRSLNKHLGRVQPDDEVADGDEASIMTAASDENGVGHKISP